MLLSPSPIRCKLFLALLALLALTPAQAQDRGPVVRVGLFQLHPIIYLNPEDRPAGLYVDLLDEIAAREGWQLEYVPGTWAEGLAGVRSGSLDLMTVVIRTEEREEYLDFCSESVMMVWGQVFAGTGSGIQNILDLDGRAVAVMTGDMNGRNFQANARRFGVRCDIVEAATHHDVFQLVQQGRVAAGVAPNIFGYAHAHEYGLVKTPIVFDPSSVTFAGPAGKDPGVLAAIDRHLAAWKAQQGSFYYRTLDRWIGQGAGLVPEVPRWLLAILAAVGLIAVLLLLWNRSLDDQVKARTRQLRAGEAKLRAIFDQSFQFLGVLDLEGRLREVNQTALKFIDARPEDVMGKPFWECPWWNHDPVIQEEVRSGVAKARSGKIHLGEATHPDAGGEIHKIKYTIKPVFDPQGRVVMLIPEGQDITEKERLEKDLRHSQKMESIGNLAGGIAHDFNNILTAIKGFNEMAMQDAADRPEIRANLQEVAVATERARYLVQQILTFSRRREMERNVFAPATVVREALRLLRSSLPASITIDADIRTDARILADPTQIHQVIMNLGTNALHAMEPEGGRLGLVLAETRIPASQPMAGCDMPPGRYVLLQVSDTGCGMDQATRQKIFEPYFTSKEAGKGTGLGLSVVHGIVESSRGFLKVESEPGLGSSFQIYFPIAQEPVRDDGWGETHQPAFSQSTVRSGR